MLEGILGRGRARNFCLEPAPGASALDAHEILRRVEAAAAALRALGVRTGDRVLFCGDQGLPAFIAFWAAVTNGAAFVPVDPAWPLFACRRALARIAPRLVLIEAAATDSPWHSLSRSAQLVPIDSDARIQSATSERLGPPGVSGNAPAACLFTSGSTADPKIVVLSRDALLRSGELVVASFGWCTGERLLNLADPHTMSGLRNAFLAAPIAGMRWVCAPRQVRPTIFSLLEVLQAVAPQRIVAAPLFLRHVNLLGSRVPRDLFNQALAVYCTGAELNPLEVQHFYARFGIPVINYYGLTETVGLCLTQSQEHWRPEDSSIGHPVGCEIRIVDERGNEAAAGEEGELQVRQRCPMSGYLEDPRATAEILQGGWLRTGDVVRRRADGSVVIVGRRANFIKVPTTEKIHPREIEAVLEEHELVAEAAVCGLPDVAGGGERIAALLVARNTARAAACSSGEIARFVMERLGSARAPKIVRWVGSIPRSPNGKIVRAQLCERFNE
jgi:acyl-coenzyme A synthetase/AMP-(fatty) acid ligase